MTGQCKFVRRVAISTQPLQNRFIRSLHSNKKIHNNNKFEKKNTTKLLQMNYLYNFISPQYFPFRKRTDVVSENILEHL